MPFKFISPEEAASFIKNDNIVGFGGFTAAGAPKVIPGAIAQTAENEHKNGRPFRIGVITGASTGESLDGCLSRAEAIKFRTPYQSHKELRDDINNGKTDYFDIHLSRLASEIRYGHMGKINTAIVEICDYTEDGKLYITTGVGITPTLCRIADCIILELNRAQPTDLIGMHDIYEPAAPPRREAIPIFEPGSRIGSAYIKVDPEKIVGIVEHSGPDEIGKFSEPDAVTDKIGENVANFLASEIRYGRIPKEFLPLQSGVGNIANAILGAMGRSKEIPPFQMYTEVMQDAVISLMEAGRVKFGSTCSLTVSHECLKKIFDNISFYKDKIILRPQEISNSPEIVQRLGIISVNTAIETDIYGNVNSSNILGGKIMNGIGGSGDFTRNAYLSIFTCPSTGKSGKISTIVPMVSHLDHSEHSVKIIITEQGIADLRAKSPRQKAEEIIEKCAHPDYKQLLWDYLKICRPGHIRHNMAKALAFHSALQESGDMRNTDFSKK